MTASPIRTLALLTVLVLGGACNRSTRDNPFSGSARPDGTFAVVVANQNWADMTIYVSTASARMRLGMVGTLQQRSFEVAWGSVGQGAVVLIAQPLGGTRDYRSPGVPVEPGATLRWTLENELSMSHLEVR
ncbi:MAG: hypothetical protein KC645_00020 [Gemmatimonadetes bacterium]|nr:hypothetical protein [Gemmatimonadota bacterium]